MIGTRAGSIRAGRGNLHIAEWAQFELGELSRSHEAPTLALPGVPGEGIGGVPGEGIRGVREWMKCAPRLCGDLGDEKRQVIGKFAGSRRVPDLVCAFASRFRWLVL